MGSVRIIGKIPSITIEIGNVSLDVDLIVLENTGGANFLLGLDILTKLEALICLQTKCLTITKNGAKTVIPFLNEGKIGVKRQSKKNVFSRTLSSGNKYSPKNSVSESSECSLPFVKNNNMSESIGLEKVEFEEETNGFDLSGV